MNNYKEIAFEDFIEQQLVGLHGYRTRNARKNYDKKRAMDGGLVLEFLRESQSDKLTGLAERFGEDAERKLLARLDDEVTARGVLDVLRNGFEDRGVKFDMAYFQSDASFNAEIERLYESNILSVIRQLKYSEKNENSIDMVLFVNGLPIFTVELKNQMSGQDVQNSISQYKTDRDPREKLLSNMRCLVHFAVDTDLVYMTTKLARHTTRFLPFNMGNRDGAGNPVNPDGHRTHYMWSDIWTRESAMEIIGKFMTTIAKETENKYGKTVVEKSYIFPRYHQRDAVRKIVADSRVRGAGNNYLIQHSAGSGKSNTIAWTAHRLSELYDETGESKVFDSVIIITDRRALDKQLRETVEQFAQVRGVVKKVEEGSAQLKQALEDGEKIITTTLQKFPFILEEIGDLPGKKFAIIIDEAHSSQSGEGSKAVRKALNARDLDEATREDDDSREPDGEDIVNRLAAADQHARLARSNNLSIFAFTATPKQKTLEIFGEKQADGSFAPFSLYTMRQAIEEGFILDVLQNYTTYRSYFELVKTWQQDDKEYEKKKAQRLLFGYVDKHEHAIKLKTQTMVEHFHAHIEHLVNSEAKAMIVTKSRLHAVRYKQAFDAYLREAGLNYRAVVAFSGTVIDNGQEYTEASMNGFPEKQTVHEFAKSENKFLIVASKYQTGFDQPLLACMYVDKKLGGVNAVQTLSRLNRSHKDKEETFVLDFVNETDDIIDAFQPYYTTTVLSEGTDQNMLYDLKRDIMAFKAFSAEEVEGFASEFFLGATHDKLNRSLDAVVDRIEEHMPEEAKEFKSKVGDYIKRYGFVSQILLFEDTYFEKLFIFLKFLKRKLPVEKSELPTEILKQVNINSLKVVNKGSVNISLANEPGLLDPMGGASLMGLDIPELELLSRIVKDVNEKYGTNFTDEDRVIADKLSQKLMEDENLKGSIDNNARDIAKVKFDELFEKELVEMVNNHFDFYQKINDDKDTRGYLKDRIFDMVYRKIKK
jgi:type I restriction enzyme R subunit